MKQNLDRRLAIDRGFGQGLAKGPDRVGIGNRPVQAQAQKAHERETVLDEVLGPLVRKIMTGLEDQYPEHEYMIEGWPAAFRPVLARHGLLKIGTERLEIHVPVQPLQIVAFRGKLSEPILNIEKARLPRHRHPLRIIWRSESAHSQKSPGFWGCPPDGPPGR